MRTSSGCFKKSSGTNAKGCRALQWKKNKENNDVLINFKILRKKIVGTCLQYFSAATPLVFYVQIWPKVIILLGSFFVVIPVTYETFEAVKDIT